MMWFAIHGRTNGRSTLRASLARAPAAGRAMDGLSWNSGDRGGWVLEHVLLLEHRLQHDALPASSATSGNSPVTTAPDSTRRSASWSCSVTSVQASSEEHHRTTTAPQTTYAFNGYGGELPTEAHMADFSWIK